MKRILQILALASLIFALTACQTAPAAATAPIASQSTVDLMLSIRKAELELERIDKMAMLQFASESKSDLIKGAVMGMSMGKSAGSAPGASSTGQTIMQAQAQADNTALRREEMAYANSWDKRLLPYVGLGLNFAQFSRNLSFQKWNVGESNAQSRFTLTTLSNAQTNAYAAGSGAALGGVTAGAGATLEGIAAVSEPVPEPVAEPAVAEPVAAE